MPVVSFTPRMIELGREILASFHPAGILPLQVFHGRYKCVPVCEEGLGVRFRSFWAAFEAALFGSGEGAGLVFTEFKSAFEGGFGGRL